jgi:PBP1b-binding outer membrane lipoprotein LpoB
MMNSLILLIVFLIAGCSSPTQEELNAKINKCTEAKMEFTYLKDYKGKPVDVICVRKHENEK